MKTGVRPPHAIRIQKQTIHVARTHTPQIRRPCRIRNVERLRLAPPLVHRQQIRLGRVRHQQNRIPILCPFRNLQFNIKLPRRRAGITRAHRRLHPTHICVQHRSGSRRLRGRLPGARTRFRHPKRSRFQLQDSVRPRIRRSAKSQSAGCKQPRCQCLHLQASHPRLLLTPPHYDSHQSVRCLQRHLRHNPPRCRRQQRCRPVVDQHLHRRFAKLRRQWQSFGLPSFRRREVDSVDMDQPALARYRRGGQLRIRIHYSSRLDHWRGRGLPLHQGQPSRHKAREKAHNPIEHDCYAGVA